MLTIMAVSLFLLGASLLLTPLISTPKPRRLRLSGVVEIYIGFSLYYAGHVGPWLTELKLSSSGTLDMFSSFNFLGP